MVPLGLDKSFIQAECSNNLSCVKKGTLSGMVGDKRKETIIVI